MKGLFLSLICLSLMSCQSSDGSGKTKLASPLIKEISITTPETLSKITGDFYSPEGRLNISSDGSYIYDKKCVIEQGLIETYQSEEKEWLEFIVQISTPKSDCIESQTTKLETRFSLKYLNVGFALETHSQILNFMPQGKALDMTAQLANMLGDDFKTEQESWSFKLIDEVVELYTTHELCDFAIEVKKLQLTQIDGQIVLKGDYALLGAVTQGSLIPECKAYAQRLKRFQTGAPLQLITPTTIHFSDLKLER